MSDFYVSRIDVRAGDPTAGEPAVVAEEVVLTLKAPYHAAERSYQKFRALGIENIGLYEYSLYKKSYAASLKAQKRRKFKKITLADVAKDLQEFMEEGKPDADQETHTEKG